MALDQHIELKDAYDVIVVGGGPSGFVAAIAAARTGATTLLVERYGFLGGMATAASLGPISPFHFGDEQVIEGIPQEFIDRLVEAGGSTGHMKCTNPHGSGSYLCFYDHQFYKWVALQMVLEAGVTPLFHSFVGDVIVKDNRVTGVVAVNKSGYQIFRAKVVVDASGDGDVAARAGVPFIKGREGDGKLQPVTMMFDMGNVDASALKRYMDTHLEDFEWASECVAIRPIPERLRHEYFVAQGFKDMISEARKRNEVYLGRDTILFLTTVHYGVFHFNSTRVVNIDGTRAEELTRGEIDARRQVMSLSDFLIRRIPGFQNAYLQNTGIQIGVRESRHILGEYVLTGEDVRGGVKQPDVVARGYFPIDIHDVKGAGGYSPGQGAWIELDDSYDIPYRCLIPRDFDGLLIAGRAISATHEAHGSFRTQGGVMAIGQAAGTAAGLSALSGVQPRELEVKTLQDRLLQDGACLRRDLEKVKHQVERAQAAVSQALADGSITGLYMSDLGVPTRKPRL